MKRMLCGVVLMAVAGLAGCKAAAPVAGKIGEKLAKPESMALSAAEKPKGEVVARVGDMAITDTMIEEKIQGMPPQMTGRFHSASGKKNLLNAMVDLEVIYREADRQGLANDKETQARLEDYRKKLAADKLREQFLKSVTVTDAEVRVEFGKEVDRYTTPKRVKVSQILFTWKPNATEKEIASVEADAKGVLEKAKGGEDFAELAKKYSLDQTTASRGGDIGYANKRTLSEEAYTAAMAMEKTGDMSGIVKGKEDIRILKATEVTPEKKKSFEEVKPWIERTVQSRKQRESWLKYIDDLKKKNNVQVFEEKLVSSAKEGAAQPVKRNALPGKMIDIGQ